MTDITDSRPHLSNPFAPAKDDEKNDDVPRSSTDEDVENQLGTIKSANDPHFNAATQSVQTNKSLGPWQAAVIFITNEIGIGILSLPAALNVLGLVPGVIAIIGMGILSLYTAYILVQFYRKYPYVTNIVDFGRALGGRPLELVFATGFIINLALICASAVITISIGLNTISEGALCTVGFIAFPTIVCWLLCMPRTMKFVAYCGWPCTVSIVASVLIVMIALGVEGPTSSGSGLNIKWIGNPSFVQAVAAYLNIAFAFSGNQAFPSVISEMRDPSRDFPKAICIEKTVAIIMYTTVAVVCYVLAGENVTSPAIGSAPITSAKISYGVIFVSLFGTGLVFGHSAIKYLYIVGMRHLPRRYRPTSEKLVADIRRDSTTGVRRQSMSEACVDYENTRSSLSWIMWIAMGTLYWLAVFVVANVIPIFDSLLNISASVLLVWFTWGIPSVLWLVLNKGRWTLNKKKTALLALNLFILVITLFMNTGGMYASVENLLAIFADPTNNVNGPFTCADNSIF